MIRVPGLQLRAYVAQVVRHLETPLYRDAYALVLSSASTSVLGIVYWTLAARLYDVEDVGLGSAAIATMTFVSGLAQLNLRSALVRFVPVTGTSTGAFIVRAYLASLAASALIGTVFFAGISWWAPGAAFIVRSPGMAAWFLASTMMWSIFVLQDSALTGLRQAVWVPIENASFAAAKILLLLALAASYPDWGIFWSWTLVTPLVLIAINALIFWRLVPRHQARRPGAAMGISARQVARYVAGDYTGSLLESFSTSFLPILVVSLAGAAANAYFYVAWMVAYSLDLVAVSMATSMTVEGAESQVGVYELGRRVILQMARLLVPAAALIAVSAPLLLTVVGKDYAAGGAQLLRLLAVGVIPYAVNAVFFSMARVQRRVGEIALVQGAIAVIVVGLSYVLLPRYGIPGVGVAWLMAQSVVAAVLLATRLRPLIWPDAADQHDRSLRAPRASLDDPIIQTLFRRWTGAGISWSVLRRPSGLERWTGDIDVLVAPRELPDAERELTSAGFARLPGYGRGSHRFWIVFEPQAGGWIEFDLVSELAWGAFGQYTLSRSARLGDDARLVDHVRYLSAGDAFWTLLLHCLLDKHEVSPAHAAQLQILAHEREPGSAVRESLPPFPRAWTDERIRGLIDRAAWDELLELAGPLRRGFIRTRPASWARRTASGLVMRALERPLLYRRRRGISVALLGSDGAGKSTLAQAIDDSYPLPVRRIYMGLWRRGPDHRRHWPTVPGLAALTRPLLIWWRYLLGVSYRARGHLVIYDRYTYDALLPARGSLAWLKRPYFWLLAHACPAPDLVFLLDAPGALLHARKGESEPEILEAERAHYRAIASRIAHVEVLDATLPLDQVRTHAVDVIWQRYGAERLHLQAGGAADRASGTRVELGRLGYVLRPTYRWLDRSFERRRWIAATPSLVAEVLRLPAMETAEIVPGRDVVLATESGMTVVELTGAARPLLLKIAWTPESRVGLQHELAVLAAMDARAGSPPHWDALLPGVTCAGEVQGRPFVVQTRLPGRPGSTLLRRDRAPQLVEGAAVAIRLLHASSRRRISIDRGTVEEWVDRPLAVVADLTRDHFQRAGASAAASRLQNWLHAALEGRTCDVCTIHGDFWLGNVLFSEDGRTVSGIVDWSMSGRDALPAHDLLHLELYTQRLLERRDLGSVIQERLHRLPKCAQPISAALSMPDHHLDARTTMTLYWLRHVGQLGVFEEYAGNRRWVVANVKRVFDELAPDG